MKRIIIEVDLEDKDYENLRKYQGEPELVLSKVAQGVMRQRARELLRKREDRRKRLYNSAKAEVKAEVDRLLGM